MSGAEWDVLCHVLAEEQTCSLPLHERFADPEATAALIESGHLARPAGGSPYLMLTEAGRLAVEA